MSHAVGNRTQEVSTPTGGATTTDVLGYPSTSNRVVQITRGASTIRQMTYDAGGNLLTDGPGKTYTYNKRNRMASATIGAIVWNYTYNGLEQLAIRTRVSPAATTHYIHDLWGNVIAETAGGGPTGATGTVREYIYLPEAEIAPTAGSRTQVDRPVAVVDAVNTASPVLWYVHVDHLHRPIRMTNAAKAAVWEATWQPWGGVHAITGTETLDARFPGQWFQLETGLHYNWHRHYDPTIGRYTQPDPLGFVDGPSVYGYARGGPQQLTDFSGLNGPQPPPSIPGGPWTYYPGPNNGRGGNWQGQRNPDGSRPTASWDNKGPGHWDSDDGRGNRQRYDRWGTPLTADEAHTRPKGPRRWLPLWLRICPPVFVLPDICRIVPNHPSCFGAE